MSQAQAKEALDLEEKGGVRNGVRQSLDRRLFMQLLAFGECQDAAAVASALSREKFKGVLYLDANDPRGIGLLSFDEDPDHFVGGLRELLRRPPMAALRLKPEFTMLGRSYAIGYEPDLEDWLIRRPARVVLDPALPWAVWYPLRRTGAFSKLPHEEQMQVLKEHGNIGRAFGDAGHAQDIRLACHGLDANDNDFVIGLLGPRLYPLSAVVQAMRKTRQTSEFIDKMGPFFVGKALWRSLAS